MGSIGQFVKKLRRMPAMPEWDESVPAIVMPTLGMSVKDLDVSDHAVCVPEGLANAVPKPASVMLAMSMPAVPTSAVTILPVPMPAMPTLAMKAAGMKVAAVPVAAV